MKMKKIVLAFSMAALSGPALCGTSSGPVGNYLVSSSGKLFFSAGTASNPPACSPGNEWAIDLVGPNAAAGRAMLAALLAAHAVGKTVSVIGKGVCDVWGDRETVDYIVVHK